LEKQHLRILAQGRPLLTARAELDQACYKTRAEMRRRFDDGVPLDELIETIPDEPLEPRARALVELQLTERDSWNDWFSLQATIANRKVRIFGAMAFKSPDFEEARRLLADENYVAIGGILRTALLMDDATDPNDGKKKLPLIGAINELSVYAGLSFFDSSAMMEVSSAIVQRTSKIDGRFHYYAEDVARHTNLYITTSQQSRTNHKTSKKTVTVYVRDFFADHTDQHRMAHLIVRDVAGSANEAEYEEMEDRAWDMRRYITQIDDMKVAAFHEAAERRRQQRDEQV
jgi:hypothetical protein